MNKFALLFSLLFSLSAIADNTIRVEGLFKGSAIITINGKQQLLRVGDISPEGVRLVEADSRQAVIEIDGKRKTLGLSQQISSNYAEVDRSRVAIPKDSRNRYITSARINGKRTQVLVDTGATVVAISSTQAKFLGVDYASAEKGLVVTASGQTTGFRVRLRSVDVSGLVVSGVEAMVIEGDFPQMILLGMSYLENVSMSEDAGIMYLESKF